MTEKIEYETITLKVPKPVMDFYRKTETNPIETLEYSIVDSTRSYIEAIDPAEVMVNLFGLSTVFVEILGDERYKEESPLENKDTKAQENCKQQDKESMVFEDNGITYEKTTLTIPKQIVDFYRYMSLANGKDAELHPMIMMEEDLADHLRAELEGMCGENVKELFNLGESLDRVLNKKITLK